MNETATTIRDARIGAALKAVLSVESIQMILDTDEFYDIAVAVVDALFPAEEEDEE